MINQYGWCKTEAKFISWLRSQLRNSFWKKHPVRLMMIENNRRMLLNAKTNRKCFHLKCERCNKWVPQSEVEINHKEQVGTLTLQNVAEHIARMAIITPDDLEVTCVPCHAIITYAERSGMSMEDAAIEKKVIAFFNKYNAAEQIARMQKAGLVPESTQAKRRIQVRMHLRKQNDSRTS